MVDQNSEDIVADTDIILYFTFKIRLSKMLETLTLSSTEITSAAKLLVI